MSRHGGQPRSRPNQAPGRTNTLCPLTSAQCSVPNAKNQFPRPTVFHWTVPSSPSSIKLSSAQSQGAGHNGDI